MSRTAPVVTGGVAGTAAFSGFAAQDARRTGKRTARKRRAVFFMVCFIPDIVQERATVQRAD
jgi:hypothetical protein